MSIRYRLEYAGFVAVSGLLRALPHRLAARLGRIGGRLYHRLNRYRRELTRENLRRALPELSEPQVRRIARASFEHHGAMFFEGASADRFDGHELDEIFDFVGWHHLEPLVEAGRGFFLLSGHFGAIEQAMYPLTRRLGPLHLVLKAQSNPLVSEHIRRMRARRGHILIYPKQAGHRMLNAVRKGGRVALQIDQRVRPKDGALMPFLGRPAWTPIILARLSTYSGRPVVPLYCIPLKGGRFRLTIESPIEPEGRGIEAEIDLTRRYLASLEAQIRQRPELWYWMHTRWRLTVKHRWPRALENLLRDSGLPEATTEGEFDTHRLSRPVRGEFERLRRGGFLEACENVCVVGPEGSGKSRIAAALVEGLARGGHPARFSDAASILGDLLARREAGELADAWQELDQIELLALDDIDRIDPGDPPLLLAELLHQRQGRRSTLVTFRTDPSGRPPNWSSSRSREELRSVRIPPATTLLLTG